MKKILFVASEVYPLIKTGGLADVAGSLPQALQAVGQDIRILMPAYQAVTAKAGHCELVARIPSLWGEAQLLECLLPETQVKVWLLDFPEFFDRAGGPYSAADGEAWGDNATRFAFMAHAVVKVAMNQIDLEWQPDVVHCNDWPCGLIPALLQQYPDRPATIFTIHNLAYQGLFPFATFHALDLPIELWSPEALEYHEQISFMKGGLVFADQINTVSPTYTQEIQTEAFGCGLEGLLTHRSACLSGILNGVDDREWNPGTDPHLFKNYQADSMDGKEVNKKYLQKILGLTTKAEIPLIGCIGRLVEQKGVDLILSAMPELIKSPVQCVFLGSGDPELEARLIYWARRYPERIAVKVGYDESLAHQIEAGVDLFLMPSRFEPCGLNQMYSQYYGTVPVVREVGGLADTVTDASVETLAADTATGISFAEASSGALLEAIKRALLLYGNKAQWKQMQLAGMRQDFSWVRSAEQYTGLYALALKVRQQA